MPNKQGEFNESVGLTKEDNLVLDEKAAEATSQFGSDLERQYLEYLRIAQESRGSDPMEGYENAPTFEVEEDE